MPITAKFEADFSQFSTETAEAEENLQRMTVQTDAVAAGMSRAGQAAAGLGSSASSAAPSISGLHDSLADVDHVLASMGIHIVPEVRALGQLGEAADQTVGQLGKVATAGLVLSAAIGGWKVGRAISDFFGLDKAIGDATAKLLGFGDVAGEVAGAKQDVITRAIERGAAASISYGDALKYNSEWFVKHQDSAKADAKAVKDAADEQATAAKKLAEEQARALQQWQDAMVEINSVGEGWQGTLDTINGETEQAIEYYLKAGVSQSALATAYGLTEAQIRAVASALTAESEAAKLAEVDQKKAADAAAHWADILAQLSAVGNGWRGTLDTIDGTTVEAIKYYLAAGVSLHTLAEAYALTDAQVKAVQSSMAAATPVVDDQTAALLKQAAAAKALAAANRDLGNSIQLDFSTQAGRDKVDPAIARWLHEGYSLAQASAIAFDLAWNIPINQNDPLFKNKGPRVPGFVGGVTDFAGGWAMVGEAGPELVNLPTHSSVSPSGRGGAPIVNHFYLVDNTENLARKVSGLITQSILQGQKIGSA